MKFIRPLVSGGAELVTQSFGVSNPIEPLAWKHSDGSISYSVEDRSHDKLGHWHNGVDYGIKCGTSLVAPSGGVVALSGLSPSGFGLRLVVFDGKYGWLLGHLSSVALHVGQTCKQGEVVASSGGGNGDWRDGNSTGCHLHWSVIDQSYRYWDPWLALEGKLV